MNDSVIIIDDDIAFGDALSNALKKRSYQVALVHNIYDLNDIDDLHETSYGIVDLRIGADSGLNAIKQLLTANPDMKIVMLTAYASIATTVEAMKLGAVNYLTKPASVEEIIDKLTHTEADKDVPIQELPLSVKRLEWEHLQKVLLEHGGNISAAARALNMHRRTLQRKLQKRPIKS